jgi:hypothetical protein
MIPTGIVASRETDVSGRSRRHILGTWTLVRVDLGLPI